jgi:hypothetical protein
MAVVILASPNHQNVGCEALFLEQFSHEFHSCVLVASSLDQKIENLAGSQVTILRDDVRRQTFRIVCEARRIPAADRSPMCLRLPAGSLESGLVRPWRWTVAKSRLSQSNREAVAGPLEIDWLRRFDEELPGLHWGPS